MNNLKEMMFYNFNEHKIRYLKVFSLQNRSMKLLTITVREKSSIKNH